jgi:hypothetical protein
MEGEIAAVFSRARLWSLGSLNFGNRGALGCESKVIARPGGTMKSKHLSAFLLVFALPLAGLLAMSCGGGTSPGGGFQTANGTGYTFIGDAPPTGTSVLKFEITLSNATLCPTVGSSGECNGSPQVSLISAPVSFEMTQLETQSTFVSLRTVATGSYAGVRLTFSNPKLKMLLPDGTIQELEGVDLPLSPTAVTPTFASGLTVSDKTNFGFTIDFNANDSIQSSNGVVTGISPVVTLVPQTFSTSQPVVKSDDATGALSNVTKTCASGTGSFTLTDILSGIPTSNVKFDSTTEFDDGATCDTLSNGQVVEADIELLAQDASTATFFAKKIELTNDVGEKSLEGTILEVNTASNFVVMVDHASGIAGLVNGAIVTASFDPLNVTFKVESNDFSSLPSFASGDDLLAGQKVDLDVVSSVIGTNNCADVVDACKATVDRVKLKESTFTGGIGQTIVNPDFALVQLPSIFGTALPQNPRPLSADCQTCLIQTMTVRTAASTEYEDLPSGFSSLLTGSTVTVRGLLFKNTFTGPFPTGTPLFMAQKVRLVISAP